VPTRRLSFGSDLVPDRCAVHVHRSADAMRASRSRRASVRRLVYETTDERRLVDQSFDRASAHDRPNASPSDRLGARRAFSRGVLEETARVSDTDAVEPTKFFCCSGNLASAVVSSLSCCPCIQAPGALVSRPDVTRRILLCAVRRRSGSAAEPRFIRSLVVPTPLPRRTRAGGCRLRKLAKAGSA
jgi:hypothetical protein